MSILDELKDDNVWKDFLEYKIEKKHLSQKEQAFMEDFIAVKDYRRVTEHITDDGYCFEPPVKILVNKSGTKKKRIVYSYGETETMVLKVMSYLLYRYDDKISSRCFSFRRSSSAKDAISEIVRMPQRHGKYCLKVDISNYFNSIPAPKLVEVLRELITDDEPLLQFLTHLLLDGRAYEEGKMICEERGAMAGIPIAPFFANIYLLSMDREFENRGICYFRYSDDILLFADSREQLVQYRELLYGQIADKGLSVNPDKVSISQPGEAWEFLGFCFDSGKVDLSAVTKNKMKSKIKRKAHSLYRWRTRKDVGFESTARTMIRIFNRKFYDDRDDNRFTWSRWFFPVLTTDEGLKELDAYLLQYIRYLYSGRHYKGNYRISYDDIKALGFRSLVHEYYKGKEV